MSTKLVELFANRVDERRNIINKYLRGRACIESVMESWFRGYWFWAFLALFMVLPPFVPFVGFAAFLYCRWHSLAFSLASGLLVVLHGVSDLRFKLCDLLSIDSSKRRLRNQVVSSLIWLWWIINLPRFELESKTFYCFTFILCFMWRIIFSCLMVCR
jgi:hypothetical protein